MIGGGLFTFFFAGLGPVVLLVAVVVGFVVYLWWTGPDPDGRHAYGSYLLVAVFVGVLVGLVAVRGLATAAAEAITDRPSGVFCSGAGFDPVAQEPGTPPPPPPGFEQPPFDPPPPPTFEVPTGPPFEPPEPIEPEPLEPPEFPELPEVAPEGIVDFSCEPGAGRDKAPADALRSGALLLAAGALVGVHGHGARRLLEEEEQDG